MSKPNSQNKRKSDNLVRFSTESGLATKAYYGPADIADLSYDGDLGGPGEFPYTRGIYKDGYRKKVWLRSITTACETPQATNAKLKRQIEEGMTGIRIIGDIPSCSGIDPDHPVGTHEVGVNGTPIWALSELETELEGIDLDSYDFQSAYDGVWGNLGYFCMLVALCEKRNMPITHLRGSTINDYLCSHAVHCFPNAPLEVAKRITVDTAEFAIKHMPAWHPFVPCGYDMGETGISGVEGIAFILANAIEISESIIQRGIEFHQFAPRIAFSVHGDMNFFETICKVRAARRLWAKIAKERFRANDPKSCQFRCAIRTSGYALTAQQPINNITRLAIEALSAVFAGAQSIDLTAYDEAHGIPSDEAETVNLAMHQILAHETDAAIVVDPLGGAFFVEWLTNRMEKEIQKLLKKIEDMGGMFVAVKSGWVEKTWERAAIEVQRNIDKGKKAVIGVNRFVLPKEKEIPLTVRSHDVRGAQESTLEKFRRFKQNRNLDSTRRALLALRDSARNGENLIRPTIEAFKAAATIGEVSGTIMEGSGYSYDFFNRISRPSFLD